MTRSMTAYGRASLSTPLGRLVCEIHSVNRKMLDMSLFLPKDFLRFDIDVRKWIAAAIERGQLNVRITLQIEGVNERLFSSNLAQLKTLKEGWEHICQELKLDSQKSIDLPFLVSQLQTSPLTSAKEEEEKIKGFLQELVDQALQELIAMKENEGKVLAIDIHKRLALIEENLTTIELKREEPLLRYRKKIQDRLQEVMQLPAEIEERVAREVAILAEKMDVTEEIVRLRTHLVHFRNHLAAREKSVGRTLDFLTQEMHREINTLGSKSADSDISHFVVTIKGELEKIREQVQNIE